MENKHPETTRLEVRKDTLKKLKGLALVHDLGGNVAAFDAAVKALAEKLGRG